MANFSEQHPQIQPVPVYDTAGAVEPSTARTHDSAAVATAEPPKSTAALSSQNPFRIIPRITHDFCSLRPRSHLGRRTIVTTTRPRLFSASGMPRERSITPSVRLPNAGSISRRSRAGLCAAPRSNTFSTWISSAVPIRPGLRRAGRIAGPKQSPFAYWVHIPVSRLVAPARFTSLRTLELLETHASTSHCEALFGIVADARSLNGCPNT